MRGELGEAAVIKELAKQGFDVFVPLSCHSRCDLVALKADKTYRIQVKSSSRIDKYGSHFVEIGRTRSNTNQMTRHPFNSEDCDILACYLVHLDKVCFIKSKDISSKTGLSFKAEETTRARFANDYLLFPTEGESQRMRP